jgi:DNA-binding beta-propeller fold protein YncE
MKFRFLVCPLAISLCGLLSCSNNNNSAVATSGTGVLYIAAQGDSSLTAYTVALSNGSLSTLGTVQSTGTSPFAIALSPSLQAMFVDNNASDSVSSYTVNSDGSLTAVTGTVKTGTMPMGMAIDPAGKFLFVANQGSSNISVFAISTASLKEVAGSPFSTIPLGSIAPTGPTSLVVSGSGNYLYVSNEFTGTVSAFSISSAGALTELGASPYAVGIAPSGVTIPPNGGFLYVANTGSNNISAFAICDKLVTSAQTSTTRWTLKPVGSPFQTGGPGDCFCH